MRPTWSGWRHVFPPERFPFPDDDVLARWALVLDEPGRRRAGAGRRGRPRAGPARGLRRAQRCGTWPSTPTAGARGLATAAVATVLRAMARRGATEAELWCLEDNHRARSLYERLGWRATDDRRQAPWPPHPTEMRYTRASAVPRGGRLRAAPTRRSPRRERPPGPLGAGRGGPRARGWRCSTARSSTSRCAASATTSARTSPQLQWVVNAYLLSLASLILVGGSLGDHLGRRRVFTGRRDVVRGGLSAVRRSRRRPAS